MKFDEVLEELFIQLFKKVGQEIGKTGKNPCGEHMAKILFSKTASKKTFTRYHERYVEGKYTVGGKPSNDSLHLFAQYLGYKSFAAFEEQIIREKEKGLIQENNVEERVEIEKETDEGIEKRLNYINKGDTPKIIIAEKEGKKKA